MLYLSRKILYNQEIMYFLNVNKLHKNTHAHILLVEIKLEYNEMRMKIFEN